MNKSIEERIDAVERMRRRVVDLERDATRLKNAASLLASFRKDERDIGKAVDVCRDHDSLVRYDKVASEALRTVLFEAAPELLRLAELRLHADARAKSIEAKRIRDQLDAILPTAIPGLPEPDRKLEEQP